MGDGYQKDQQSLFFKDLDRNLAVMWATEPFRSYRNYINVYAVEIASVDYGVRCDPDGRKRHVDGTIRDTGEREGPINTKNTALRMIYDHASGSGCTAPLARGVVYGGAPPGCEAAAPYGGIGGAQATTSGGSPAGPADLAARVIAAASDSRNLDLEPLNLAAGTVIHAEVRDPVGPDGIDWVRNPSTNNASTSSGYNGARLRWRPPRSAPSRRAWAGSTRPPRRPT